LVPLVGKVKESEDTMMFEEYDEFLTINDVIKMLKYGRNKVYELVNSGEIKSFGKPHRIPKKNVINWVENQISR
jgi:predicted DNA-binding transcriptional regulator AlpA